MLLRLSHDAGTCCLPCWLFKASLLSCEYGKGIKAALSLAECAVQMFKMLPALTSQLGEKFIIGQAEREREKGGLLQDKDLRQGVYGIAGPGFSPEYSQS